MLVNNAGLTLGGRLQDQPPDQIERLLRLNLWAVIRLTQLVLPHMLAQSHGYILNIGSGQGRVAVPLFTSYVASKYGLAGFTDALRREVDGTGVRLTLALPSWTHTAMLPPGAADVLERYGFQIEHPDDVAERAVLALVRGQHEIVLGGALSKLGVWLERFAPGMLRLYWRFQMTPAWVAAISKFGRESGTE